MKHPLLITSVLLCALCFASVAAAQDGAVDAQRSAPSSGPSIGIEGGLGQYTQVGWMVTPSGHRSPNGNGTGFTGSLFFDLPISRDFFVGLKAGLDFVNTPPRTPPGFDISSGVVESEKLTLLKFEPYIQYQIVHSPVFIQVGVGISDPLSIGLTEVVPFHTSSNGVTSETFQGTNNNKSLLFSGLISLGYNFNVSSFTIAPIVTYDHFINVNQINDYNWNFNSFKYALGVKYNLH